MRLILGSASPRRKEILENAGYCFIIDVVNTVEDVKEKDPELYVKKTALKKGQATLKKHFDDLVISADTIVVLNDEILEKPKDKAEAYKMIKALQNNTHLVYTAVYIGTYEQEKVIIGKTAVSIASMTDEEINEYIATSEPFDKAGGYAIQGVFAKYIEKIDGDYYNVMGLPLHLTYLELKKYNI